MILAPAHFLVEVANALVRDSRPQARWRHSVATFARPPSPKACP
jgi:hypothetical protein